MSLRCAIYTRVSTDHGLDQEFNSLDNQREAAEAYVKSQAHEGWKLLPARYDDGGFSGGSMERPALQRLLEQLRARRIDVIVVYKVDRLTRSLADFAKLVELFDAYGVSFVSVTQAFNTTTSMGRLTLNVLLSFAQFEREVTSERIRDKIAASKKKGIWVGGMVPLGYAVESRRIVVVENEAERVRLIFRRYQELGSIGKLLANLRERGIFTKVRPLSTGRTIGGIPFTRGPLAYLLRNRFYISEVRFKGTIYPAEHPPILDRDLFEAVQHMLTAQQNDRTAKKGRSGAILAGKLYDIQGRRMTPSHATKQGIRYRYYVTANVDDPMRVSAPALERIILDAVEQPDQEPVASVTRIELGSDRITIERAEDSSIVVPWQPSRSTRHREVIAAQGHLPVRTMRAETRATLLTSIARGRRWLEEISTGTIASVDQIAVREGVSARAVNKTISLAFVAPDIVEAAIAGTLPHGIGLRELIDPPPLWRRQRALTGQGTV